jgi:BirA family biotin operon repressor/biotin-[acetyl-CoA-carboxylase] ligase
VGINLKLSKKQLAKIDQPAIGINQCIDNEVDTNEFLGIIIKDLTEVLAKFESNNFEYFKDEWQSYDAFQDQSISISLGDGGIISGKEHGVNNMGALEVITEDGIKTFSSGEVSIRKED